MSARRAVIGLSGPSLTDAEAVLLRALPPAGVILFGRNVRDPAQLAALTGAVRALLPEAALLVDQEGGRVARLRPPHWQPHPAAAAIGAVHAVDPVSGRRAAWLQGALIGGQVAQAGFGVACAPVLDLRFPGASDVVGDRAFAAEADAVATLGVAFAAGMLAAGVQPVGKHAPGHGQATVDSHLGLPVVAAPRAEELAPFRAAAGSVPWMMTAHVLYPSWDAERPGTLSPRVLEVIRTGIGFGGVLVSDDLAMGALTGSPAERAAAALEAGCDLAMHCSGVLANNRAVLEASPEADPPLLALLAAGRALARDRAQALDPAAMRAERTELLAMAG
jgi:beta-N-acetylhexosaminidase